jgi:hypothetical protein
MVEVVEVGVAEPHIEELRRTTREAMRVCEDQVASSKAALVQINAQCAEMDATLEALVPRDADEETRRIIRDAVAESTCAARASVAASRAQIELTIVEGEARIRQLNEMQAWGEGEIRRAQSAVDALNALTIMLQLIADNNTTFRPPPNPGST